MLAASAEMKEHIFCFKHTDGQTKRKRKLIAHTDGHLVDSYMENLKITYCIYFDDCPIKDGDVL